MSMSEVSLSLLYFNKTFLHKSSERSSLASGPRLNSSLLEAKNSGIFCWFSNNLSVVMLRNKLKSVCLKGGFKNTKRLGLHVLKRIGRDIEYNLSRVSLIA